MAEDLTEYAFDKDLTRRLHALQKPVPNYFARWSLPQFTLFLLLFMGLLWLLANVPNRFANPSTLHVTVVLGTLGLWRFGWWFTHALRAQVYARTKWPGMRKRADELWDAGWRPKRLHIQMTTYYEEPSITKRVVGSILGQIKREGIPTSLYIGTGSAYDEQIIRDFVETYAQDIPDDLAELIFIRQNQPGKRMAIGLILRAISRSGASPDDLVIFMDGDALFGDNVLRKTLSMFGSDRELQALTTDEEVICYGPQWIAKWLDMRFAQRRLAMPKPCTCRAGSDAHWTHECLSGTAHSGREIHPHHRSRPSEPLALGAFPIFVGRRQVDLVPIAERWGKDDLRARCNRLHDRGDQGKRADADGAELSSLVRQHATQWRARHCPWSHSNALLHLVVCRRSTYCHVDDDGQPHHGRIGKHDCPRILLELHYLGVVLSDRVVPFPVWLQPSRRYDMAVHSVP